MLSDTELDQAWANFDPYQYHQYGNELCPECFKASKMCFKCGGLMHNASGNYIDDEGNVTEETMTEYLCEDCGYYHID